MSWLYVQTIERLDELFQEDNITSSIKVFESEQGVSSIQDQLFVSKNSLSPFLLTRCNL